MEKDTIRNIIELLGQGRIAEAKARLQEVQSRVANLEIDNMRLKVQVNEFEDIIHLSRNLLFDGACCWLNSQGLKYGPFCAVCYQEFGLLVRLNSQTKACPSCGSTFENIRKNPKQVFPVAPPFGRFAPNLKIQGEGA